MFSSFFNDQKKKTKTKKIKSSSSSDTSKSSKSSSSKKRFKGKRKRKNGKTSERSDVKRKREEDSNNKSKGKESNGVPFHPFKTEFGDHFSTSNVALCDFVPVLKCLRDERREFRVYDPYYCDGSVKQRLKDLGFPNVIHENRDFYADVGQIVCPIMMFL